MKPHKNTPARFMPLILVMASILYLAMGHMALCYTSFALANLFWLVVFSENLKP